MRNMSQLQLAETSGLSQSLISALENRRCQTSYRNMKKIAAALNVSVEEIDEDDASDVLVKS